ncbi:substrate-binding domain-containing protein [Amycolatopsis sp. cmx-8-4]|uniref:substrate-binding domain-containing protein n=1 Tax=Amycolatopsis sp. cmx-8-4 TaxID=2790947 RepID=UPI00397C5283
MPRPTITAAPLRTAGPASAGANLGVIVPNSRHYGPVAALTAVEEAAHDSGFTTTVVTVAPASRNSFTDAVLRLTSRPLDGIVVIARHLRADEASAGLPTTMPVVLLGGSGDVAQSRVFVDQYEGARMATEHLLRLGHRTVWHVGGPECNVDSYARQRGWQDTLAKHLVQQPPLLRGDWSSHSGYVAGSLLAHERDLDAVFVANDQMAFGVIRAFTESGIAVPRDIHVVGFDDVPEAAYATPSLTTVRQDFAELGKRALHALLARIGGGSAEQFRLLPQFLVRESSASVTQTPV